MTVKRLFLLFYPAYRLLIIFTLALFIYTKLPRSYQQPLLGLGIYLLLSLISFKNRDALFQFVVLVADVMVIFVFSNLLDIPPLIILSLPPLFSSYFLTSTSLCFVLLILTLIVDIKTIKPWYLAFVSHTSIFLASFLFHRETRILEEKRQKESLQKEFEEKLQIAKRLSMEFAHEVRNPLMNISAVIQMVKACEIPEKVKKLLETAERELERASKLASDFLKLEVNHLEEEVFNLCEFLHKLKDKFPYLDVQISCSGVLVKADKKQLERAISNIIQNCIEAKATEVNIKLVKNENKKIVLEISDNGVGIDESIKEKIFLPFFTTKDSGTGLGLAIAKNIIEKHKGEIRVKDRHTFEIRLPSYEG